MDVRLTKVMNGAGTTIRKSFDAVTISAIVGG